MKNITSDEFEKLIKKNSCCILPTGSYEQHGSHCVLETDFILADYISGQVGNIQGMPVLPAIPFGISYIHKSFPGTIYLEEKTYLNVIVDILNSLKRNNLKKVFILNGHGGNYNTIKKACDVVNTEEFECYIYNWFEFIEDEVFTKEHRSHAGSMETSALLAINEKYVRQDRVENMILNKSYSNTVISDILECTHNGVIGIADEYSHKKGIEVLNTAIKKISIKIGENYE